MQLNWSFNNIKQSSLPDLRFFNIDRKHIMNSLLSSSSNANIGGTFPDGSTDIKDGDEVPPENVELRTLNGEARLSPDIL